MSETTTEIMVRVEARLDARRQVVNKLQRKIDSITHQIANYQRALSNYETDLSEKKADLERMEALRDATAAQEERAEELRLLMKEHMDNNPVKFFGADHPDNYQPWDDDCYRAWEAERRELLSTMGEGLEKEVNAIYFKKR